jgi:outer membrane immunogenic protein
MTQVAILTHPKRNPARRPCVVPVPTSLGGANNVETDSACLMLPLAEALRGPAMRKFSLTLLAAAIALTASQASAADLGVPPPAPVYRPLPIPIWNGCYFGGNIGGAWGKVEASNVSIGGAVSKTNSGVAGGIQVGCDYQTGAWVIGLRDMFDGTSLSQSATFSTIPFTGTANSDTHWFDTLTARGGYLVIPNILLYVQGGAAWTDTDVTFANGAGTQLVTISNSRTGWTVGGGAEWMFAPQWSVFAEYNFMGFGTRSAAFASCSGNCVLSVKGDIQDVLVGVNYYFYPY